MFLQEEEEKVIKCHRIQGFMSVGTLDLGMSCCRIEEPSITL
jgi:hypothetical protein